MLFERPETLSPVEISKAKEFSLLFLTDLLIGNCEGFKVGFQHPFHWVIRLIGADSPGTQLKLSRVWVPSFYHDTPVHLGRVQSPVRYSNESHTLLSMNELVSQASEQKGQSHYLCCMTHTLIPILHIFPHSHISTSSLLSAPSVPSSRSGCNAFSGKFGESSASPTSSSTTTETYLLVSSFLWNLLAVLKTSITLSGVESWLHW